MLFIFVTSADSSTVDDLQMDAMMQIVNIKSRPDADMDKALKMESLYSRGEQLRNKGMEIEAADQFRQLLLTASQRTSAINKDISDSADTIITPIQPTAETVQRFENSKEKEVQQKDVVKSKWLTGGESVYSPSKKESLKLISAKVGVSSRRLAWLNNLSVNSIIEPGKEIRFNNLRIVPKFLSDGILINVPDKTLYLFSRGKLVKNIPVSVGKGYKSKEKFEQWQTPSGKFTITAKTKKPAWKVPESIKAELAAAGKKVQEVVKPGKNNPLGDYAIRTSISGILIHSTNSPASVYGFSSHGCIRVAPWEMENLFKNVGLKTSGEIIYEPVKLAVTENNRVFLEISPDIYNKVSDIEKKVRSAVARKKADNMVDWGKIRKVIKAKKGVAEDVTSQYSEASNERIKTNSHI